MSWNAGPWGLWWRLGERGIGFQVLHDSEPVLFSERYGYHVFRHIPLTPYRFRFMGWL